MRPYDSPARSGAARSPAAAALSNGRRARARSSRTRHPQPTSRRDASRPRWPMTWERRLSDLTWSKRCPDASLTPLWASTRNPRRFLAGKTGETSEGRRRPLRARHGRPEAPASMGRRRLGPRREQQRDQGCRGRAGNEGAYDFRNSSHFAEPGSSASPETHGGDEGEMSLPGPLLLDRFQNRVVGVPLPRGPRVVGWINQTLVLTNEREPPDATDRVRIGRDCGTDPRHARMVPDRARCNGAAV